MFKEFGGSLGETAHKMRMSKLEQEVQNAKQEEAKKEKAKEPLKEKVENNGGDFGVCIKRKSRLEMEIEKAKEVKQEEEQIMPPAKRRRLELDNYWSTQGSLDSNFVVKKSRL